MDKIATILAIAFSVYSKNGNAAVAWTIVLLLEIERSWRGWQR